jgi:predicted dehydrogenase
MDKVRVGLAGCGTIANVMHLPGLRTMQEMGKVEIVAVCDTVPEKAAETAARFDIPAHFGAVGAMLAAVDFDLLVNTTPIPEHAAVSRAGLAAGRHVYTQKPMASTVEEATSLIDLARECGVMLASAPEHPVRPVLAAIKRLVDDGAIGAVAFARVVSSHDGPERHNVTRDSTWFYQPGSSPILDLGVHGLSQITAVLGPVQRLACMSGRTVPERVTTAGPFTGTRIPVRIDDNSLLLLDFGGARFAFLDASYCVTATLGPHLEIHGIEGTIAVAGGLGQPSLQLHRQSTNAWEDIPVPPAPAVRDLGVLHLVDCLREGQPLVLTGERGRHLVEVLAAAPEAAKTGRTIEIASRF